MYKVLWRNHQVLGVLWLFSTVTHPAVCLGQWYPVEDESRVILSEGPGQCGPWDSLSCGTLHSVPHFTSTLVADWTWPWVFLVREGEPWWDNDPAVVQLYCCSCLAPLSLCGTGRIERRGDAVILWGSILLLKWKLHFLLNPLDFDAHLVAGPSRNGLARRGWTPWLQLHRGPWHCSCESGKPCRSPGVEWSWLWAHYFQIPCLVCPPSVCWLWGALQRGLLWQ